ncbi:MAG: LytTR family DNA-binding domain-containing protein, partial [Bacteroidota bacterium]
KADGNYTEIHLINGRVVHVSKCLKNFVPFFEPNQFCRIHASFLVNMRCVAKYHKGAKPIIEMDNGDQLKVSRNGKQQFLDAIHFLV